MAGAVILCAIGVVLACALRPAAFADSQNPYYYCSAYYTCDLANPVQCDANGIFCPGECSNNQILCAWRSSVQCLGPSQQQCNYYDDIEGIELDNQCLPSCSLVSFNLCSCPCNHNSGNGFIVLSGPWCYTVNLRGG